MQKYELSKEILNRAYYWMSFNPEKRAERFNAEYMQTQNDFINFVNAQDITDEQKNECLNYWLERLYKNATDYLAAESRCISWAITGPAKFPVKKAEKAQASAESKLADYVYTLEKMKNPEIFNRYLTTEQKQSRVDAQKWREISETLKDFIDCKKESAEKEIDGVRIVENTEENRLQLFFDGKPAAEVITLLKQHAFKWSPRFKTWQRILTPNAKFVLTHYVLPKLKESAE